MKKSRLFSLGFAVLLTVILCLSLSACGDTSSNGGAGITDNGLIWAKGEDGVHITGYFGITEDLVIPASIQNTPVVAIGNFTFQNNAMLKTITIPDSVITIGDRAFYGCHGLTSVTIGNSVTTIGDYAFYDCDGLTSITIPDSVTTIGSCAFYQCGGLTSIVIPDSVTAIGSSAFEYCYNLKNVYYTGTAEQWAQISIGAYNSDLTDATIHYNYVPEE